VPASAPRRHVTLIGWTAALAGIAVLGLWLRRIDLTEVWIGFQRIGWGLALVVLLGGLRFAARAFAWTLCYEPPHRLAFRDAFGALVAGDALGNVIPMGPLISEPTKAAFVRARVPLAPTLTALAIENVLYTLSVAAVIAAGMLALLFQFDVPLQVRELSEATVAAVIVLFLVALWFLWKQPALLSRAFDVFSPAQAHAARLDRVRGIEQQIYTFVRRRRQVMFPLLTAELAFHALGVLEAWLTLWMIQRTAPSWTTAFILEAVNRLITVAFKVVPMQVGVNETGTSWTTVVLGLGGASGLTLGLVRRVRMICWTLVGILLLGGHGLTAKRVLADPELTPRPADR
jgi:lysylphosphatidylglycerol synthase-like protein